MIEQLDRKNAVALYEVVFDDREAAKPGICLSPGMGGLNLSTACSHSEGVSVDPGHSVGAVSCGEVAGYFERLQVQDCDLIFSGDSDVGSGSVWDD